MPTRLPAQAPQGRAHMKMPKFISCVAYSEPRSASSFKNLAFCALTSANAPTCDMPPPIKYRTRPSPRGGSAFSAPRSTSSNALKICSPGVSCASLPAVQAHGGARARSLKKIAQGITSVRVRSGKLAPWGTLSCHPGVCYARTRRRRAPMWQIYLRLVCRNAPRVP